MADVYTELFINGLDGDDAWTKIEKRNTTGTLGCAEASVEKIYSSNTTIIETEEGHDIYMREMGTLLIEPTDNKSGGTIEIITNVHSILDQL